MNGMMTTCGICGKRFVVPWPQHWVYKRKDVFLCGEDCMIVYDTRQTRAANGFGPKKTRGAEENMAGKLTQKQREEVVEIAIQGGSPIEYLKKECGAPNPWATWAYIKKKLKEGNPVKYNRLLQVETLKHVGIDPKSKMPKNFQDIQEVVADRFPPNDGSARIPFGEAEKLAKEELESDIYRKKPEETTEELEEKAAEVVNGEIDLERDKEELALEDLKFPMKVKGVKETAAGLEVTVTAKKVDKVPPVEIPEQPVQMAPMPLILQGGVDYQMKVNESRKARKPFKVIGLETEFGTFMMGTVNGVIHFESEGNAEISMVTEDWVKMAGLLPEILRELGVDA